MIRTPWKLLLAVSLALNIGFGATVALKQWQNISTTSKSQVSLPDHLNLSPAQREHWHSIEQDFIVDLTANWDAINLDRKELINQIFSEQPERAQIDAIQARIAALQNAQQQRVIAQLLAEHKILDVTQRNTLKTLLLNHHSNLTSAEEQLHKNH